MGATINDIAQAAGVSKATVSRFLNDRSRLKEETALLIDSVIKEFNYIPNGAARNLAMKQADRIGVLISHVRSAYWNEIYSAMHDYLSRHMRDTEVFSLNCDNAVLYYSKKSIRDKIRVLAEQRVAGIILLLRDVSPEDVDYISEFGIPFVVVQSDGKDERVSCVNIDNRAAVYGITQYLLGLGHKDIVYVSGPADAVFTRERFEGYREAMFSKRLYRKERILHGDNSTSDGYWRAKQILSWNPRPTAILYASDSMAFGGMQAIRESGLDIPRDISVAGFDGYREQIDLMDMLPPLTTVMQPIHLIGEKTAEIIMCKIRDKEMGIDRKYHIVLPTGFIDNGSCAVPGAFGTVGEVVAK